MAATAARLWRNWRESGRQVGLQSKQLIVYAHGECVGLPALGMTQAMNEAHETLAL